MAEVDSELLSAYADGDLSDEEQREVELALAADPRLQAELQEIRELQELAGTLALTGPSRDLWPEIRERVLAPPWWKRFLPSIGLGAVAAAAGAVATLFLARPQPRGPSRLEEPSALVEARRAYGGAIEDLEEQARTQVRRLPLETRKELEQSLAQVDQAIERAHRALREAPEDAFAHRVLLALYDEKIRVLQAVIDSDEGGSG